MVYNKSDFAQEKHVSRETMADFEHWEAGLIKWNKRINLVSRSAMAHFWQRHALDSWQIVEYMPEKTAQYLDLGSGAGFPGLAIAIALKHRHYGNSDVSLGSDIKVGPHVTLVESVGKKTNFLKTLIRELDLPATALCERIEELPQKTYDVISARAFASLPSLLTYAHPFWSKTTIGLFLKGEGAEQELTQARKYWTFNVENIPSRSDPGGVLLKITDLMPKAV